MCYAQFFYKDIIITEWFFDQFSQKK